MAIEDRGDWRDEGRGMTIDDVDKIAAGIAKAEGVSVRPSVKSLPPSGEEGDTDYYRRTDYRTVRFVWFDMPSKVFPDWRVASNFAYSTRELAIARNPEAMIRARCEMAIDDMRECERLAESSAAPP